MRGGITPLPAALRSLWRYALALLLVVIGVLLRAVLTALVGPGLPTYITFYPFVMLAALIGGLGPGLLATLASVFVAIYWLLPPVGSFKIAGLVDLEGAVFFSLMGVILSIVAGLYRRTRDRLEELVILRTAALTQANESLQTQGEELQRQAEELTAANSALRESEQRYKVLNAELELRVQERTAELKRKNQELQEFAFVASHDLNEPLRKIQAFGSLLTATSADRLDEERREYISRITTSAKRMQDLLTALLNYSRVETKVEEFRPTPLGDVVRDAISDLEVGIREAGAEVSVGELPIVNGDRDQLRQLFENLIGNAIKYRRTGVNSVIYIRKEQTNGHCRILVEDNGIGFEEKYLNRIFQPFQRLHGKHEYEGTGIGLAICKKVVERHGGTITARSTPGKGSTFIVTLPVQGGEQ